MNKWAFTLIELIVGITISMILMVWVGVFMSNWMQNIFLQQKILENTDNFSDFAGNLSNTINLIQTWYFNPVSTWSGIIFKRWLNYWEWGFSYVWTQEIDWIYCSSGSEDTKTKNIYIKTFIPYEENGEDIFSDYNDILTWSLVVWSDLYVSDQKNHLITKNWTIIVWKGIFWNEFQEWVDWTQIYLNSPTWMAHDWTNLYISDTLNNRILYIDASNKIHTLLDESDWLEEPTWLYYINNQLYIANSWKWEILKYSSQNSIKKLNINFNLNNSINNLKKINIKFYTWITNISNPDSTLDFSFTWITSSSDYLTWSTNDLTYWLSNFADLYQSIPNSICSNNYEIFYEESGNIIKQQINNCNSFTWTIEKYRSNSFQDLVSWSDIGIGTNGFINWSDFSINWNYYVKITLEWDTSFSDYFNIFTQSDWNIITPDDNILSIEKSWLNYPTWIWWPNNYNEFGNGGFSNLDYSKEDNILKTPIENLDITNNTNNVLSIFLTYYKNYNCYNLDDKAERSFLWKKNLK